MIIKDKYSFSATGRQGEIAVREKTTGHLVLTYTVGTGGNPVLNTIQWENSHKDQHKALLNHLLERAV